MSDPDRVHVFSNGTEYEIWTRLNCQRCIKRLDHKWAPGRYWCPLEEALDQAYIGDGLIPREIAVRMGRIEGEQNYAPICPELEVMGQA